MGDRHRLALQEGADEGSGEGIAGTDGIGHLHLRSHLVGHAACVEDIASVGAAGQDEHLQAVLVEDVPALFLQAQARDIIQAGNGHQFLIIDFQDVAALERCLQHLLRVETLTEVDVEYLQAVCGDGVQERADGTAGYFAPLCQGTEANRLAICGQGGQFIVIRDIVPCDIRLDLILGHTLRIQGNLDSSGGILHPGQVIRQLVFLESLDDFLAQRIVPDSAHGDAFQPELAGMIGEIGGRAAQFLSLGKHIPQRFTDTDNVLSHIICAW